MDSNTVAALGAALALCGIALFYAWLICSSQMDPHDEEALRAAALADEFKLRDLP